MTARGHWLSGLLWLFPRGFRERYGPAFAVAVQRLAEEPRYRGLGGTWRLTRFLVADAARAAPREWRAAVVAAWQVAPHDISSPRRHRSARHRMDTLLQDFRFAVRSLRRTPGFAAVVVISLALGIGANTLVYSVLDGIVLHPFAFPDPDRLMVVGVTFPKISSDRQYIETLSPPEYVDIRDGTPSLERVSAFDLGNRSISGGDYPERVFTAFVWGDPLATLGLAPALGRSFRLEETTTPGHAVAVLSHRIWVSRFGGDSSLVGKTVRVNAQPMTVIGVLPPAALLLGTDLWMPMGVDPQVMPRRAR
ncbi:MAG: ABC transporter permease, partial [Gemmatimonadaceae bacterium]